MTEETMAALEGLVREAVRDEVQTVLAGLLAATLRALDEQQQEDQARRALPEGISEFDRELARAVSQVYRNQGRKPVTTMAIACHIGYSRNRTRELLKEAEQVGALASVPGKGRRHSGRWLPASTAA